MFLSGEINKGHSSSFLNSYTRFGDVFISFSNERNINRMWAIFNQMITNSQRLGHPPTPAMTALSVTAREEAETWLTVMSTPNMQKPIDAPMLFGDLLPRTSQVVHAHSNIGDMPPNLGAVIIDKGTPLVMQAFTLPTVDTVICGFSAARNRMVKYGYHGALTRIVEDTLEIFHKASASYKFIPPPPEINFKLY